MNDVNPKQEYGDLKVPLAYVPFGAIISMALALKEGARKYGPFNWRETKVESMTYAHAALRHLYAWIDGEDLDPESGNYHLDHAMACLAILQDARDNKVLVDNRPPKGRAGSLLRDHAVPPEDDLNKLRRLAETIKVPPHQRSAWSEGSFDVVADERGPLAFSPCEGCHSGVCEMTGTCQHALMHRHG